MKLSRRTQMILSANFAVMVGEILVMFILPLLDIKNESVEAMLDGTLLMAFTTPVMFLLLRKSELDLEVANRQLAQRMTGLDSQARDRTLTEEMGEFMLASRNAEETYGIVARYIGRLMPGTNGSLYILRSSRNSLEEAGSWGEAHQSEPWFSPVECWGFRRGKRHEMQDPEGNLCCTHVNAKRDTAYCCMPLIASGEALGLLHIETRIDGRGAEDVSARFKPALLTSLAEHIALALANNKLQEELQNQSIRDPLTGLFNRRFLDESFLKELHRAQRKPEPVGVIMVDLDHFKAVNDEFGHDAGDAVLRALSACIQKEIRVEDIACRLGGEEFVMILPGMPMEILENRARHLLRTFPELRITHNGRLLKPVTASIGLACFPQHGADPESLLRAADTALYASKHNGRNQITVAEELVNPPREQAAAATTATALAS